MGLSMITLAIDNPQIEKYFSNSADKLREFLEYVVKKDDANSIEIQKRISAIDSGKEDTVPHNEFWSRFDDRINSFKHAN